MKIGEFSTRGEISKDTIRYYVEEGLLIPDMADGHMSFSQRDINDLDYIKKCKTLGFNIREIKFMMAITRTSHLTEKMPSTIITICWKKRKPASMNRLTR